MIDILIQENNKNKINKFIIRLIIFVNNHYKYNLEYLQNKYNIKKHSEFILYFKKNYKKKILFSSMESESLFINFINIDLNYMSCKYKENYQLILVYFFIARKKCYFNHCDYIKSHVKNLCNCKIKVNSVVNLNIDSLIYILKQHKTTNIIKCNIDSNDNKLCTIKMKKNTNNKNIIGCLNNLEKASNNLGMNLLYNHHTLESNSSMCDNDLINSYNLENSNKSKSIFIKSNSNLILKNNIYKSQFLSESINLDNKLDNLNIEITKKKNNNKLSNVKLKKYILKVINSNKLNNIPIKKELEENKEILSNSLKESEEILSSSLKESKEILSSSLKELEKSKSEEILINSSKELEKSKSEEILSSSSKESEEILSNSLKESEEILSSSSKELEKSKSEEILSISSKELKKSKINKLEEILVEDNIEDLNYKILIKNKDDIKKHIDIIINYLKTDNNILINNNKNTEKIIIELKKKIKQNYSVEIASKFDRLYKKSILIKTISDTEDMNAFFELLNQFEEFKNTL